MVRRRFCHRLALGFLAGCSAAAGAAAVASRELLVWGDGGAPPALGEACWPCLDLIDWPASAWRNAAAPTVVASQPELLLSSAAMPAAFLASNRLHRRLLLGMRAPDNGGVCGVQLLLAAPSPAPACVHNFIWHHNATNLSVPVWHLRCAFN